MPLHHRPVPHQVAAHQGQKQRQAQKPAQHVQRHGVRVVPQSPTSDEVARPEQGHKAQGQRGTGAAVEEPWSICCGLTQR
jgi:hypothetical protein